ncbi:MAG TPA: hypothetical protein VKR53_09875 [Puia sp.]|nr:hypothetical protein [Puia sp.]
MKSIEECLDMILHDLVQNWDLPDAKREWLKGEDLLKRFELPDNMHKHEFFKRLIRRLIKDDFAETNGGRKLEQGDDINVYEQATLITIEGYYFIIEQNGYTQREEKRLTDITASNDRNERMERNEERLVRWNRRMTFATIFAGLCGLALAVISFVDLSLKYHWFSCH